MIPSRYMPDQKILAGGLGSIAAFALVLALRAIGIEVPMDLALIVVAAAGPTIGYLVPQSVADVARRLDALVRDLALSPGTDAGAVTAAGSEVIEQARRAGVLR